MHEARIWGSEICHERRGVARDIEEVSVWCGMVVN